MAKKVSKVLNFVVWLTGVIVALAVGFGMTAGTSGLTIPWIPVVITQIAGWVVIVTTLLGVILALLEL